MIISKAIGIDLGTTNSAVAVMNITDTDIHLYKDSVSRSTVPSCISCNAKKASIEIGHAAFIRRGSRHAPVVSIKRKMGTSLLTPLGKAGHIPENIPEETRKRLLSNQPERLANYIKSFREEDKISRIKSNPPLLWLPEEISALIINEMRNKIFEDMKEKVSADEELLVERGIVTVPAYFDLSQTEATREAGRLAGLELVELLNEPTAAAVYYSWQHQTPDGIFMVYDLGGGTFDVSILRRTCGEFEVLGTSGDNFLGGDEFDRLLAEWMRKMLVKDGNELELDANEDPEDAIRFQSLVTLAERAKKKLSYSDAYLLSDQNTLTDKEDMRVLVEMNIQRSVFEDLIRREIWKTIPKCWEGLARAYRKSRITLKDIDQILLVGGSTHIPLVKNMIAERFCALSNNQDINESEAEKVLDNVEEDLRGIIRNLIVKKERAGCEKPVFDSPGTCVAKGAAIRASATGTIVYDDERQAQIQFRGQGGTSKEKCNLTGFAQKFDGKLFPQGTSIRVCRQDGSVIGEEKLRDNGFFRFRSLDLQNDAITTFKISILDESGNVITEMGRKIERKKEIREIGGVMSTAVLSKPILLELVDRNRLIRAILIDEGTSLRAEGCFRFFLRDQSKILRFPLFQGNRQIKEVVIDLDQEFEIGTPMDFIIKCDENTEIKLTAIIEGREFNVDVGPPPPPLPPTDMEIRELIAEFNRQFENLREEDQHSFRQRLESLLDELRQAMIASDNAKAINKFADMEGLIKSMDLLAPRLTPPWQDFERMYAQILDITMLSQVILTSNDAGGSQKKLDKYYSDARRAWSLGDQQLYSEAKEKVESFGDVMRKQLAEAMRLKEITEDIPDHQRALMKLSDLVQQLEAMIFMSFLEGNVDLIKDLSSIKEQAKEKEKLVHDDSREVLRWCQEKRNELSKYKNQLSGDQEIGSQKLKGGLVSTSFVGKSYKFDKSIKRIEKTL